MSCRIITASIGLTFVLPRESKCRPDASRLVPLFPLACAQHAR